MSSTDKSDSAKEMREHAWKYFTVHAAQRLSVFNFFILLSSLVATGSAVAVLKDITEIQIAGSSLGLLLAVVSFVFAKLDRRVSFLIKRSEESLAILEKSSFEAHAHLFAEEPKLTAAAVGLRPALFAAWTYGTSFRFIFWVMGLVGFGEMALGIVRVVGSGACGS